MTGFALIAVIVLVVGVVVAYRAGARAARHDAPPFAIPGPLSSPAEGAQHAAQPLPAPEPADPLLPDPELPQLRAFADDRRRLLAEIADARGEIARYRQIVIDIEHNAPPPLLDAPGTPDDLKLIVGVGPVIERMLYQLGIATYRQIARWSERDIDEFDARLREFPGRIRRDGWVTQARALHVGKYGSPP